MLRISSRSIASARCINGFASAGRFVTLSNQARLLRPRAGCTQIAQYLDQVDPIFSSHVAQESLGLGVVSFYIRYDRFILGILSFLERAESHFQLLCSETVTRGRFDESSSTVLRRDKQRLVLSYMARSRNA